MLPRKMINCTLVCFAITTEDVTSAKVGIPPDVGHASAGCEVGAEFKVLGCGQGSRIWGSYFVTAAERMSFLDLSKPVRYRRHKCSDITSSQF